MTAIADTGANGHFCMQNGPCIDVEPTQNPTHMSLPDGSTITSSHTGLLPIPQLPTAARQAHIFPALATGSLLLIGQLCDAGCRAEFNRNTVQIHHQQAQLVASGTRTANGLWSIQMKSTDTKHAAYGPLDNLVATDRWRQTRFPTCSSGLPRDLHMARSHQTMVLHNTAWHYCPRGTPTFA
jgi:hypothetical protein